MRVSSVAFGEGGYASAGYAEVKWGYHGCKAVGAPLFLAGNGTPVGEFKIRAELFRDLIAAISKEARYVQRL